jgi:hypothetical protein
MRVPEHQYVRLNSLDHMPVTLPQLMQLSKNVTNDQPVSGQFLSPLFGKLSKPVVVPLDRKDRSDLLKTSNDFNRANITSVDYRVDAVEDRGYCFVEQSVRV